MDKYRHLRAVEAIDEGLAAAEQITIPDAVRSAMQVGRISLKEGAAILECYGGKAEKVVPLPDEAPKAGWSNGVVTLRDPVESGWDTNPEPPDTAA